MKNWGLSLGLAVGFLLLAALATAGVFALSFLPLLIQALVLGGIVVVVFTVVFRLCLFNDR